MGKYLISTSETYRVNTEEEAQKLIEEAKHDNLYSLNKYTSEYKEKKSKGEVIDQYYKVVLTKIFNDINDTENIITINYEEY